MDRQDFEARKAALLQEIRSVMDDVEELYSQGAEQGGEDARELKGRLEAKLDAARQKLGRFEQDAADALRRGSRQAKERFRQFEEDAGAQIRQRAKQADEAVREKPYYAMGFAALAGLVVGVLLNRR
ncbi:MAG: DUF883 family protein [Neisseria sp.]|nr:DUF883 family protein [Neisseria sp.]